jgi:hypothetical protein
MSMKTVKKKLPISVILFGLALLTFLASWAEVFPEQLVERIYFRVLFPRISGAFGVLSDGLPISWLDVWILVSVALFLYACFRRRWKLLLGAVSLFYLWFFWGWGLNYHRPAVASRFHLEPGALGKQDLERFTNTAIQEINQLYPLASSLTARTPLDRDALSTMASERVDRVVYGIDGVRWPAAARVKRSRLAELWYRSAGVDGMFNPFGHEPLVIEGPLAFELPFLMAHELAHVRGVANEGEANLIALLAMVTSEDPRFQYSGWLYLWGYLRNAPADRLHDGPRADLSAVRERLLRHHIPLVGNFQTSLLDAHLKANAVAGGVRSYSDFVTLAIATQPRWKDFR